tara:strand:- start:7171 stop:8637 length:1467 start_codon:yes stop_codon:yes gene_type:complete
MAAPARTRVYVSDSLPEAISDELTARGLLPLARPSVRASMDAAVDDPESRALLVHVVSPTTSAAAATALETVLAHVAGPALDKGVRLILVVDGMPADQAFVTRAVSARFGQMKGSVDTFLYRPNVILWTADGAGAVAQTCAAHTPGMPWADIPVEGDPDDLAISAEDKGLLQRAFSDCDGVCVRRLQERTARIGKVCVYRVQPRRTGQPDPIPFIVKIGHPEVMDSELGATQWACGDHTPYPYFPPLAPDRFVSGHDRRALVSHFIDRAILFERYIQTHSPAMAVASLFDGPLRCWRSHGERQLVEVGKYAFSSGVAWSQGSLYRNAHRAAQRRHAAVRTPWALIAAMRAKPGQDVYMCGSHGDLHLKNLFVRENSVDIVLIDFNRAGQAPASRDPAELEVSLAFSPMEANGAPLDAAALEALYTPPLLNRVDLPRQSHPRALAIEQVRRQAAGTVGEDEYRVMVAAHCLYYARKRNADAYLAADRLI